MQKKPHLSFWQIWNMSFGFFGIQFGWGLQMANMSSIYEMLGASESSLPLLWLAAPVTGLIVQPIVGFMSDRTWGRLGRRRPYFLVGAVLASLALIAMPNSSALWIAAGLLWILDTSVNISMEPFRAFVGDKLPEDQRKRGFAMQSLLIGFGAVLSSALPFILSNGFGISKEATVASPIPPSVTVAFYVGACVFFFAVLYTILTTGEYPPEDMEKFLAMKRESSGVGHMFAEILHGIGSMPRAMRQLAVVQFFTWLALFCMWIFFVPAVGKGIFQGQPLGIADKALHAELTSAAGAPWVAKAAALAKAYDAKKEELAARTRRETAQQPFYGAILQMFGLSPASPDAGSLIDSATLSGLIAPAVTAPAAATDKEKSSPLVLTMAAALRSNAVTGPDSPGIQPAAEAIQEDLAAARRYQEGAAWGGVCFSMYNLVAFVFAFVLLAITKFLSAKQIHIVCLLCGAAGLLSAAAVHQAGLLLSMAGVGIAWASILSMPYAMLANVIPAEKMGFYMGVFNFFIVLPQILAALALGPVIDHWLGGHAMNAVLMGGTSLVLAALLTLRVQSAEHRAEA